MALKYLNNNDVIDIKSAILHKLHFFFYITKHVMIYWIYVWLMESAGDIWKLKMFSTKTFKFLFAITPFLLVFSSR